MSMPYLDPLTLEEENWLLRRWKTTLERIEDNWKRLNRSYDRNSLIRAACSLERGYRTTSNSGKVSRIIPDTNEVFDQGPQS